MIQIERFFARDDLRNFSYLVYDGASGSAWVIDPWDARPFAEYIKKNGLTLKGILNTHGHFDHVRGNDELVRTFNAPVMKLHSGEKIDLGDKSTLDILSSPGHTSDHQVFLWQKTGMASVLFSGDTIFNAGVGNCRGGGNVDDLYQTVKTLTASLPLDTILQPGHDYLKRNLEFALSVDPGNNRATERMRMLIDDPLSRDPLTLREEKELNPFLRLDSPELQEKFGTSGKDLFIKLRALRDTW